MILLTILLYAVIVLLDQVQTYRTAPKKDFIFSCVLGLLSFAAALVVSTGERLPSPSPLIERMVSLLLDL
ncbi:MULTISPECIES: hypothetical protein [Paenibacillus]|jgi:hypothetical protein|uniref:Uncharacterized protein n=2 Tax=Paenibacillus barengoltzii TaxID=343517 RepID=R9LB96_9BACL|nr:MULTISPECIES: hypothetical protein [Paenibacillus]EOS55823.1 hypothetical protein C812_02403 [Paenibacillus barengoltzii G22]MDU0330232.1 hypothetical protein [Paenibacillus sp. 3LSP]SMF29947.1 hypothetical protein SAMN02744102_02489 [Paenibacillus barengoltzii]SMF38237.1 hypothetical protein SAMN02744124_02726 [Paenibacillus barengoltzii J12]